MARSGSVGADRLKSFVERIEKLREEKKAAGSDERDVFSEAKGVGYDTKTIRRVLQLRAMDAADRAEQETLLDTYLHALGMESHGLEEQANERALKRFREIDRCMRLTDNGQPPRIDAIMRELGCSSGKASAIRKACQDRLRGAGENQSENENENEMPTHDPETGEINDRPIDEGTGRSDEPAGSGNRGDGEQGRHAGAACPSSRPAEPVGAERGGAAPAHAVPDQQLGRVDAAILTDEQAFAAMEDARLRLVALKRERGLPA